MSPYQEQLITQFEAVQKRAVKWILSEQNKSYSPDIYIQKLQKLDLLPIKFKFMFTDLSLFHKIISGNICISVPTYLRMVTPDEIVGKLRTSHLDPLCFKHDLGVCKQMFDNSFFSRTYMYWNRLPLEIKMADSYDLFQLKLKEHIWKMLMEKPD